jgi:hypothetical protein
MALLIKSVPPSWSNDTDEFREYNRHLRRMERLKREIADHEQRELAKLILAELEKRLKAL